MRPETRPARSRCIHAGLRTALAALVAALGLATAASHGADVQPGVHVDPELLRQLAADPTTGFVIDLREQADLTPAYGMSWDARGRFVVDALREVAEKTQPALRERLAREGVPFEPFWIANRIVVESGSPDLLLSLLDQPEILAIRALPRVALVPAPPDEPDSLLAPGWNIAMVRAPEAWGMGVTGEGIVVAIVDTGVRATHEALRTHYRGWDGGSYRHDYSFFDPGGLCGGVPCDFNGHGTHVTGSAVGDDGAANQIGVAPGAEWIACNAHCCPTCGSCLNGGWLRACLQWLVSE